jgi:hypothetical protein
MRIRRIGALSALLAASVVLAAHAQPLDGSLPRLRAVGQSGGSAYAVAVADGRAYVGLGARLVVFDLADPARPTLVGQGPILANPVTSVALAGRYAYVTEGPASQVGAPPGLTAGTTGGGLHVLDVSAPATPFEVGFLAIARPLQVAVVGTRAYVAAERDGLRVVDVDDPARPRELGSYGGGSGISYYGVAATDRYAYLTETQTSLRVVDVSDPTRPTAVGALPTQGCVPSRPVVVGSLVYLEDCELMVVDVADATRPRQIGAALYGQILMDIHVAGTTAYAIADADQTLRILDVSDPTRPAQVGSAPLPFGANAVTVAGGYAYVADYEFYRGAGLLTLDVRDPGRAARTDTDDFPQWAHAVAVRGAFAFVADDRAGVRVLDVGNPTRPLPVALADTPGSATDLALDGAYAYVADGTGGLRVLDVNDPRAPSEVGALPTSDARDVAVAGAVAYVADGGGGLRLVSVADPRRPTQVATVWPSTTEPVRSVAVTGGYALAARTPDDQLGGLGCFNSYAGRVDVVDARDPAQPRVVGTYASSGGPRDVVVAGSHAYVAEDAVVVCQAAGPPTTMAPAGVRVLDVSDPGAPRSVAFHPLGEGAVHVAVAGGRLYVTVGGWGTTTWPGVRTYDAADPAHLVQVASLALPVTAGGVSVANGLVYVAGETSGVWVLALERFRSFLPLGPQHAPV